MVWIVGLPLPCSISRQCDTLMPILFAIDSCESLFYLRRVSKLCPGILHKVSSFSFAIFYQFPFYVHNNCLRLFTRCMSNRKVPLFGIVLQNKLGFLMCIQDRESTSARRFFCEFRCQVMPQNGTPIEAMHFRFVKTGNIE